MSNAAVSSLVAVVATLLVVVPAVVWVHNALGEFAILAWIGGGLVGLWCLAAKANAR